MVTRVYTVNELECYGVNFVVYGYLLEACGVNDMLSDRHLVVWVLFNVGSFVLISEFVYTYWVMDQLAADQQEQLKKCSSDRLCLKFVQSGGSEEAASLMDRSQLKTLVEERVNSAFLRLD